MAQIIITISIILAKCVMNVAKEDVAHASGSLQLCAGQKSSEAAVHAMLSLKQVKLMEYYSLMQPMLLSHSIELQAYTTSAFCVL